jgi:PhzF family phenazine biosynthesis protein
VVPNADGLTDAQMQMIARELRNSETAFVFAPKSDDHDVYVRFFTPTTEVPSCGHATIAAHYVRAIENELDTCTVRQQIGTGVQLVNIVKVDQDYTVSISQGPIEFADPFGSEDRTDIISAIGATDSLLDNRFPPQTVSLGHSKIVIGVRDTGVLHSLDPNMSELSMLCQKFGCTGCCVFTVNSNFVGIEARSRVFAPAIGIPEDPVTGNAMAALGPYLVHHGFVRPLGEKTTIKVIQGEAMGRPGIAEITIEMDGERPASVEVCGRAVLVFNAVMEL